MPKSSNPVSRAEQLALLGIALLFALQSATAVHGALEYQRVFVWSEPWRLLTAHFVHINWVHAIGNGAGWLIVARLFAPDLSARAQVAALLAGALTITLGLALLYPWIQWYRGMSGALHALFFAGASVWTWNAWRQARTWRERALPLAVLIGGWIKVALEQPTADTTPYVDWLGANVVPQAHLLGALAGTAAAVLLCLSSLRSK